MAGVLFYFSKKQNPPVVAVPQVKKVLDEQVISPTPNLENNALWYFTAEARLFRVNLDGTNLTEFALPSLAKGRLSQVLWSKTGSDFIASTVDGEDLIRNYYSDASKVYVKLASNIQSFDWLPDDRRIVYVWKSGDNQTQQLALANADGTGFKTVSPVFYPDLAVKAGNDGKTVLLYRIGVLADVNKIYAADLETGQIITLVGLGKNLGASWISNNRFLFAQSATTPYPKIYLYDLVTKQATDLDLNTLLDKIAVDKDGRYLYAAAPKKDNSGDTFVKIDLSSFRSESYFEPVSEVRVKSMMLIGEQLYFVDNRDSKIYTISK